MQPQPVDPVKLFCGVLLSEQADWERMQARLWDCFGPIDYTSKSFVFDATDYYQPEMGAGIRRLFVSFERLIDPAEIVSVKLESNRLEEEFLFSEGGRSINLDPGYMDTFKVVLASAKSGWQKIYLDRGIYADPTLYYRKGAFYPFEWGFPDFKGGLYNEALLQIRQRYKLERKKKREQS